VQPNPSALAIACTLSPGDYAERLRAFRRLFAASLRGVRREPTHLPLTFEDGAGREGELRDLLRREQECCPFFGFAVAAAGDALVVEVTVPDGAEECLDDLVRLAGRARAGSRA